jgi:subtilase family serine protease
VHYAGADYPNPHYVIGVTGDMLNIFGGQTRGLRMMTAAVAATLLAGLAVASASAAPAPPVRLAGSAVPFTRSLAPTGLVPGGQRLTIQVWLAPRDPAGAARYAMAASTPGSALFHRFLSPDAYTARFGGTTAEADAIAGWLHGAGFSQVTAQEQRSYVRATAPVSVIDTALGTRLRYYRATSQINAGPDRLHANDRAVQVPAALAPAVLAITGLDNEAPDQPLARPARPAARPAASKKIPCSRYYGQHRAGHLPSKFGVTSLTTSICGYTAAQLRDAYGADRANDGRGQTIALVELGLTRDMFLTLQDYARASGLPAPDRSRYAEVDLGQRSCPDSFDGEEQLDVEAAYDMALGARELVVSGNSCGQDAFQELCDALLRILGGNGRHPLASIASNSWEDPGAPSAAQQRLAHAVLVRAAAEGVGMYFSSGDFPGVRSPSDDPFATGVGGTSLAIGRTGGRLFETGWSSGVDGIVKHHWASPGGSFAAGGGPSPRWAEPAYQQGIVPPALSRHGASRSVPDLSALADPTTGISIGMLAFPRHSPPRFSRLLTGGTSLASPLVAGLVADAQQGHRPFGFLNPVLYRLAGTTALHDVLPDTGRARPEFRAVLCASNAGLCSLSAGNFGRVLNIFDYQARSFTRQVTLAGYDDMTGLGSPNGQAFITALRRLEQ